MDAKFHWDSDILKYVGQHFNLIFNLSVDFQNCVKLDVFIGGEGWLEGQLGINLEKVLDGSKKYFCKVTGIVFPFRQDADNFTQKITVLGWK